MLKFSAHVMETEGDGYNELMVGVRLRCDFSLREPIVEIAGL